MGEFLQGDYEIQSPIGLYSDIPEAVMTPTPAPPPPRDPSIASLSETEEAIRLIDLKRTSLETKVTNGVATDEEKEEYYELPDVLEKLRIDLFDESDKVGGEIDKEIVKLESDIEGLESIGLWRKPDWVKLKEELTRKKVERSRIGNIMKREQSEKQKDDQIESVSNATGIPESEIRKQLNIKEKRKEEAKKRGIFGMGGESEVMF